MVYAPGATCSRRNAPFLSVRVPARPSLESMYASSNGVPWILMTRPMISFGRSNGCHATADREGGTSGHAAVWYSYLAQPPNATSADTRQQTFGVDIIGIINGARQLPNALAKLQGSLIRGAGAARASPQIPCQLQRSLARSVERSDVKERAVKPDIGIVWRDEDAKARSQREVRQQLWRELCQVFVMDGGEGIVGLGELLASP